MNLKDKAPVRDWLEYVSKQIAKPQRHSRGYRFRTCLYKLENLISSAVEHFKCWTRKAEKDDKACVAVAVVAAIYFVGRMVV